MKIKGCKRQSFLDQAVLNGGQPIFYLLHCYSKEESFYKLGITMNHIMTRYGTPKAMPYDFEILLEHAGEASDIYDMEVKFKTEMNKYHYKPQISFNGSISECYTELSEALQELINEEGTF